MVSAAPIPSLTDRFEQQFEQITGYGAFPWQKCLFSRMRSGQIPSVVGLPTGTGKTSIIAIWLLALAEQIRPDRHESSTPIPRRLIWVVNRRVVVDQATDEAEQLRDRLKDQSITELGPVRAALKDLSLPESEELFGISTLRGQFADNGEWRNDPARPAVIIGTVDMIGSRLLFSGYGAGFRVKPLHAGFLGQDSILVHDEAHLEPAFQALLTAIQKEQERCKEFGRFQVIELSATARGEGIVFGLTKEEKSPPIEIPDPPREPIHVLWRRLTAKKTIYLHSADEKNLPDLIVRLVHEKFATSVKSVLIFLTKVDDVEKVVAKLRVLKQDVQQLTGTLRGLERDRLATDDSVFRQFTHVNEPKSRTAYLVCTSAGEVGINISADHLVCDLSTFDSMVQRFGRVNRFGDAADTEIHVLHPSKFDENEFDQKRKKTLELLRSLEGDASLKAIGVLRGQDCVAAFAPTPTILATSDILFDFWSLTTIRGKLPGRPPVEPYLHGLTEREPPETHVAWREEVGIVTGDSLLKYRPEDLLDDYPLKPHELLRDRSGRVFKHLEKLALRQSESPVWLLDQEDGSVEVTTITELVRKGNRERINYLTLVLPPAIGGLDCGLLNGDSEKANDVADEWTDKDGNLRRIRVWDDDPELSRKTSGLRLIRTININGRSDEEEERDAPRCWHWYELPKSAKSDGSKNGFAAVEWQVHTDDVIGNVEQIIKRLPLSDDLRNALVAAAKFHDLGKRRPLFQRILGNPGPLVLAKAGKRTQPYSINETYRHEFGSLLDIQSEPEFRKLSSDMQELVLHLIATHHGRGRPHFPTDEAFDPEPRGHDISLIAAQVPQRFARLQRKYGRWGLAYLESLLRAADYAASANPSAVVEEYE